MQLSSTFSISCWYYWHSVSYLVQKLVLMFAVHITQHSSIGTRYLNSRTVVAPFASRGSEFHLSATLWLKKFLRSSNLEFSRTIWCPPSVARVRPTGVWWNHLALSTSSISFKILKACTRSWPCLLQCLHSQHSEAILIGDSSQACDLLHHFSLHGLEQVNLSPLPWGPRLDCKFEVWPHIRLYILGSTVLSR